jgi:hypothetical protein
MSACCVPVFTLPILSDDIIDDIVQEIEKDNVDVPLNNFVTIFSKILWLFEHGSTDDLFPLTGKIDLHDPDLMVINKEQYEEIRKRHISSHHKLNLDVRNTFIVRKTKSILDKINLPPKLRELNPTFVIQRGIGNGLLPHTDISRVTSLYCLISDQPNNWKTVWYNHLDPLVNIRDSYNDGFLWPYPDPDMLVTKESHHLISRQWYLFDNITYHGVSSEEDFSSQKRISISIEFNVPMEKLLEILNT